jgi:hypothetical protein
LSRIKEVRINFVTYKECHGTARTAAILDKNSRKSFLKQNSLIADLDAVPPLALHGVVESPLVLRHAGGVQPGIILLEAEEKFLIYWNTPSH